MRRKIFTLFFGFVYQHPRVFRVLEYAIFKLILRVDPDTWRDTACRTLPEGKRALELGCGIKPSLRAGALLDLSFPSLKAVPQEPFQMRVCASALSLPFANQAFDWALSVFPPGISTDEGFFQEPQFWEELGRALSPNGAYIALVYVDYKSRWKSLLARIIDPLPDDFWEETKALAQGFEISKVEKTDPGGNTLLLVEARKARGAEDLRIGTDPSPPSGRSK